MKKSNQILLAVLSIAIGLYPIIYFVIDREFGLLSLKNDALLVDIPWNIGFYTHIVLGGVTLLVGWSQFSSTIRNKNLPLHRLLGKIYVFSAIFSAIAGIYVGFYASGGIVSASGFICLGIVWLYTTLMAYIHVRQKRIDLHERMMVYSYAACFAAVTLRIWNPILILIFGDFFTAYKIVAWLCWVPNLVVAFLINKKTPPQLGHNPS